MISDEEVKELFRNCHEYFQQYLEEYWQIDTIAQLVTQIFFGVAPEGADCSRDRAVFKTYNIIPKSCFDCYKVFIEPGNVVELFKLVLVFKSLSLQKDNARKCYVEHGREGISGTYGGLIYSRNLKEAINIVNIMKKTLTREISANISVKLKRGCSEFPLVYPEYAKFDKNGKPVMKYKKKWQKYEDVAAQINLGGDLPPIPPTFNHDGYNLNDAITMVAWLKYAATIEDLSYKKITDIQIRKLKDIKYSPSQPVK